MLSTPVSSLPTEVCCPIIDHLDRQDLLQLVRVSRHFQMLLEPLIFSNLEYTAARRRESGRTNIHLLLRSIASRKELALYVKSASFYIKNDYPSHGNSSYKPFSFTSEEMTAILKLIRRDIALTWPGADTRRSALLPDWNCEIVRRTAF
jgi:F-box-like